MTAGGKNVAGVKENTTSNCQYALKITCQPLGDLSLPTALTATLLAPWNVSDERLKTKGQGDWQAVLVRVERGGRSKKNFLDFMVLCRFCSHLSTWGGCQESWSAQMWGVFAPVVRLLWSESADELVDSVRFPLAWFDFTHPKCQANQNLSTESHVRAATRSLVANHMGFAGGEKG